VSGRFCSGRSQRSGGGWSWALTSFGQARPSSGSDGGAITPSFNHGWIRMPFNGPVPGFSLIRSSPYDDAAAWRREYLK